MSDHRDEPHEERLADDQEINGDLGKRSRTLSRKGLQYAVEEKRRQTITIHKRLRGVIKSIEEADSIADSVLNNLVTTAEEFNWFPLLLQWFNQCDPVFDRYHVERSGTTYKDQSMTEFKTNTYGSETCNCRVQRFFLSRQDHDRGFAAHNHSFATKKKPSGTQGTFKDEANEN